MKQDVFYVVTVPSHLQKAIDSIGLPAYYQYEGGFFFEHQVYVPQTPTTYKHVVVPEEKYYFKKRKKAKKFLSRE